MHENVIRVIRYIANQLEQSCDRVIKLDVKSLMTDVNYKLIGHEDYYSATGMARLAQIEELSKKLFNILSKIQNENSIISFEVNHNSYGSNSYKITALDNFENFVNRSLNTDVTQKKTPNSTREKIETSEKKKGSPSRFTKMIKSLKAKPEYNSPEKLWDFLYDEALKGSSDNQTFRGAYEFSEFEIKQNPKQQEISFKTFDSKTESSMKKSSFRNAYKKA